MKEELRGRLLEAFSLESRDHLARVRQALRQEQVDPACLTSLHTLKGSARAIGLEPIEQLSHRLEEVLQHEPPTRLASLTPVVDLLEDLVAAFLGKRAMPDYLPWLARLAGEQVPSAEVPAAAAPVRSAARVSADELRGLLESSTRLVAQALQLQALGERLSPLSRSNPELVSWRSQFEELSSSLLERAREVHQQTQQALLAPAGDLLGWLASSVRELADSDQKKVDLVLEGMDTLVETPLLQALVEPLLHLMRNAIRHGLEEPEERVRAGKSAAGRLRLALRSQARQLVVVVEDDGRGLGAHPEQLFEPGFSTARQADALAGRGMGLPAVRQRVEQLGGSVGFLATTVGARLQLVVPTALAAQSVLLVTCAGETLAIPSRAIRLLRVARASELRPWGERLLLSQGEQEVPVVSLARRLGLIPLALREPLKLLLLEGLALQVDDWVQHLEVVVHPLELPFPPAPHLLGAFTRLSGDACLVLNPAWLLDSPPELVPARLEPGADAPPTILVVDDSLTTRTLAHGMLTTRGYRVLEARDGLEALEVLQREPVKLVVSDVQMPRMSGLELLQQVKRAYGLPVILLTSLVRPEDRQRGLALGADAYLAKHRFDQSQLLEMVHGLLRSESSSPPSL